MKRSFKLAFLVSIVLNMLFAGVLLGELPNRFERRPSRQERIEQALKKVPEPAQTRVREKLQEIRTTADPLRQQINAARDAALGILNAEAFDEAAYDRQVNEINDLQQQMFQTMARVVKRIASELSPDDRHAFAEVLRRPPASR